MRVRTAFAAIAALVVAGLGPAATIAQELTEGNAAGWGTFASDAAATSVADDASRVQVGRYSLKFVTASGFDTGIRYPKSGSAHWDLRAKTHLFFWTYAINETPYGFQGNQPVVVLKTPSGDYRYEPTEQLVPNRAWRAFRVPLAGSARWTRTQTGSPNLADVSSVEIHQDTWDSGFVVYYDGVEFVVIDENGLPPAGPPPPPGVDPDLVVSRALLFVYDPVMENLGGLRMHQAYGWLDPRWLTARVVEDLAASSHGRARFEVAETIVVDDYPVHLDGFRYDDASYDEAWRTGTWHASGFDYARFIADANLAARIARGDIDEVWVYGAPGFGMWESTMAGDGGYWCNSGPVQGVPSERVFVVMGWNYERGVAEAIHSFGHRVESTLVHGYGPWTADRSTTWNAFTLLDKDAAGQGSVGNCHFPVNGLSDYDYEQPRFAWSDAEDWLNYPNLTGARQWVNVLTWSPDLGDPHRQYLNWWYARMPHVPKRAPDGYLANWWRYIVDIEQFKGWDGYLKGTRGIPAVTILGPTNGQIVAGAVPVEVRATVDGALGRVDLYVDGGYLASDLLAPFSFSWNASLLTGSHTLVARAYELQNGTESVSAPVTVSVFAPPPNVPSEVSPPGSAQPLRFTGPASLAWAAAAASGSERFNLYRGNVDWLRDGQAGSCLRAGLSTNGSSETEAPSPGTAWFYLVTGVNGAGEGTRGGDSAGLPRAVTGVCR